MIRTHPEKRAKAPVPYIRIFKKLCITPLSQTAHHAFRIKTISGLKLLLKEQSDKILSGWAHSSFGKRFEVIKGGGFTKPNILTPQCIDKLYLDQQC